MRIAFIETAGLTNELIRAVAGAHPLCVGYPDGVPESWRDTSACVTDATEAPVEWRETRGKHPECETHGGAGGGLAFPGRETDPAALLGPVTEPVDWRPTTYADLRPGDLAQFASDLFRAHIASRGDWPDDLGDDEC